jgi:hypothetical protein
MTMNWAGEFVMSLARLIYASRSNRFFTETELADLVARSSARNATAGITGSLVYCDGYFLQWLEGNEHAVRATFERISKDPRHRDVQEMSCRPILGRSFGQWGMSFLHEGRIESTDLKSIRAMTDRLQKLACWDEMSDGAAVLMENLKSAIDRQTESASIRRAA